MIMSARGEKETERGCPSCGRFFPTPRYMHIHTHVFNFHVILPTSLASSTTGIVYLGSHRLCLLFAHTCSYSSVGCGKRMRDYSHWCLYTAALAAATSASVWLCHSGLRALCWAEVRVVSRETWRETDGRRSEDVLPHLIDDCATRVASASLS